MNTAATSEEFVPAWQVVKNVDTMDIPPFAVVMVDPDFAGTGIIGVKRPTEDNMEGVMFVNSGGIPAGREGMATFNLPAVMLYDTADAPPERGQGWGTASDSFKLKWNKAGFTAVMPIAEGLGLFKTSAGNGDIVDIGLIDETDVSDDGLCFGADVLEHDQPLPTDYSLGERVWLELLP